MFFNLQLYKNTVFQFSSWVLQPRLRAEVECFALASFSYRVRIFNLENLQASKLFNYFYLSRYFFGQPSQVFFLKKYFILGKTYHNLELGFHLNKSRIFVPLSIFVFQVQPLVNLALTRDFVVSSNSLQLILRDPSIFSERKTNTGLFDLTDPLTFCLTYRQPSSLSSIFLTKKFLSSFKIIIDNL
jgi:hypothetical protein